MAASRHVNTLSRRAAVQVLYMAEITEQPLSALIDQDVRVFESEDAPGNPLDAYACQLLHGVEETREELDELIDSTSDNWAVSRMPIMDRSILRLAVYEMKYVDDVPQSVSINEAVDLAKEFGGEDESHRFVNGVLGQVARTLDAAAEPAAEEVAAGE